MFLTLGRVTLLALIISSAANAQEAGSTATGGATAAPVAAGLKSAVNPKDGLTYVWIAPGKFQMGCSSDDTACGHPEKPAHMVTLTQGFWIGQTPVTQVAYKKVMGVNPSHYLGDQLPVQGVSWNDAKAYCERAGAELPTEAEWEYAARGGNPSKLYGPVDQIAWYGENSGNTIDEVGKKQPNGFGLYDMIGDVFEWVADWYGPYDSVNAVDPKGPSSGEYRVLRGAGWTSLAAGVRVSYRDRDLPAESFINSPRHAIGLRCASHNDLERPGK